MILTSNISNTDRTVDTDYCSKWSILFYSTWQREFFCADTANTVPPHGLCSRADWSGSIEGIAGLWSVTRAPRPSLSLSSPHSQELGLEWRPHTESLAKTGAWGNMLDGLSVSVNWAVFVSLYDWLTDRLSLSDSLSWFSQEGTVY